MEKIDFFEGGGGTRFYFFFQKPFLAHFSITFLSAIQVLVWYKNLSYFFAEYHRLEAPLTTKNVAYRLLFLRSGCQLLLILKTWGDAWAGDSSFWSMPLFLPYHQEGSNGHRQQWQFLLKHATFPATSSGRFEWTSAAEIWQFGSLHEHRNARWDQCLLGA